VMNLFAGDMQNWSTLARGMGARLDFVLQPAINWTKKPLTPKERKLFDIDWVTPGYYLEHYATQEFYEEYRGRIIEICKDADVAFHDANEWLNDPAYHDITMFIDVCHLTDHGNKLMAELLRRKVFAAA
jgi:hypothetical protein